MKYDEAATSRIEEVYEQLVTGPDGLTDEEARNRLLKYGPNKLPVARKRSLLRRLIQQMKNAFNLLLFIAAVLSFLSGLFYNDPGSVQMGGAIVAVVVLNTVFSLVQEYRAERAVQAINKMVPRKAKVVRDTQLKEVEVSEVVLGDIVALDEGDRVPADLRLTRAFEVSADNSVLTGESDPQMRFANMTPGMTANSLTDYQDILFAGTTLVTGVARGVVISTGEETQFGRIVAISSEIEDPTSPLQKDIDYTARINLFVASVVGAVFFLIATTLVGLNVVEGTLFAIGVMVCLVPEGFQLTVSLSLALSALKMTRRNVVVKRLSSIETAGSMNVLCVDKTGTITSGEMMVRKLWAAGKTFDVTGDGYSPEGFVTIDGRRVSRGEGAYITSLFEVAAYCSNAKLNAPSDRIGRWTVLGDPTDGAFLVFAAKGDFNIAMAMAQNPRTGLIPFDSRRRMMTSIHNSSSGGERAYTKGSPQDVLAKCTSIFYNNEVICLTEDLKGTIQEQILAFASDGYRVLAMDSRNLPRGTTALAEDVEKDMTFLGLAALQDPPRPKTETAVKEAKEAGIKVIMITGDLELTAETIAKKVGIITSAEHKTITGEELNNMSDDELSQVLDTPEVIFARTTPEHKLRVVRSLMARGNVIGVTGDGVNDSPALIEANVGIAVGAGGTDVARESADMVLLDNDFTSIIEAVRLGRATFDNLRKFVYYVYTHNWAELVAFIVFILLRTPLPLLVIQVLAIDLFLDVLPSLALIMEPPEPDIMAKPPRSQKGRLINISTLVRAGYIGLVMGTGAVLVAFNIWGKAGWVLGTSTIHDDRVYAVGTTAMMAGIMAGQVGNLFSARSSSRSAFSLSLRRNKWILVAVFIQVVIMLTIIYLQPLQSIFGTAPLELSTWVLLYSLAPIVLIVEEIRKCLTNRCMQDRSADKVNYSSWKD